MFTDARLFSDSTETEKKHKEKGVKRLQQPKKEERSGSH